MLVCCLLPQVYVILQSLMGHTHTAPVLSRSERRRDRNGSAGARAGERWRGAGPSWIQADCQQGCQHTGAVSPAQITSITGKHDNLKNK